jgi:hypothetical protein
VTQEPHRITQLHDVARRLTQLDPKSPDLESQVRRLASAARKALKAVPVVNPNLAGARQLAVQSRRDAAASTKKRVIPHIDRAKRAGFTSFADIAQYLNAHQVAPPKGTHWFPTTVQRILNN